MQSGHEPKAIRSRRLAGAAFIALSLPLWFVAASPELPPAGGEPAAFLPNALITGALHSPTPAALPALGAVKIRVSRTQARRKRIVVSIPERKLALMDEGHVVKTYRIAVGADTSPSPTGEFKIVNKVADPTYYRPGVIITPGPANPLGSRWLGLDREHFGIHGTNEPQSIGRAASHGCIRMANADVEELFALARAGDTVEISTEPFDELALLVEAGDEVVGQ